MRTGARFSATRITAENIIEVQKMPDDQVQAFLQNCFKELTHKVLHGHIPVWVVAVLILRSVS